MASPEALAYFQEIIIGQSLDVLRARINEQIGADSGTGKELTRANERLADALIDWAMARFEQLA